MLEHFCECYSDLSGPILCPVLGIITPLFITNSRIRPIRLIGLCASLITFLYSPVPRIQFDPSTAKSQFVESLQWLPYENINFFLGIDGISLFFMILTTFLIPICISVGWSGMRSYGKEYITASLIREFLMIVVFRMLDPLLFYVLPESVPIPMFIVVGVTKASRQQKITLIHMNGILSRGLSPSAYQSKRLRVSVSSPVSSSSFLRQREKAPSKPPHSSKREGAYVFAKTPADLTLSTPGANPLSVLPARRRTRARVKPFISGVTVVTILYGSRGNRRTYSDQWGESLALSNIQGIGGSTLSMLSHGLAPSALFLCVGVLYDRHKARLVRYYGGLVSTMPNLSTISFSSTLANMSSPGTSSFIREFPISVGAFQRNSLVATLAVLGMILGVAYSLWLYNRLVSGNLKPFPHKFSDSNGREVSIFIPFLLTLLIRMGVHPKVFPDCMHTSVSNLVQHGKFH
ncbi:LOW QUALITY PROTEIN: Oxidored_q1 domain-containing protein, partial [Cephalotus follicularis]